MTTDLVPYDWRFPDRADRHAYDVLWARRAWGQAVRDFLADLAASIAAVLDDLTVVFRDCLTAFTQLGDELQAAGMLPPDPADMLGGQRWVSPVDGTKWRVAGQRHNRHWIEAGPRGWRR